MRIKIVTLVVMLFTTLGYTQTNGKFTPFHKSFSFNNVTIQHVRDGYEETKLMDCKITIDSRRGTVHVEMGNERPEHYLISTSGITRELELGNKKVLSFRLSPVSGKGDYMMIRPGWGFIVLMVEEEQEIYIFKNVKK